MDDDESEALLQAALKAHRAVHRLAREAQQERERLGGPATAGRASEDLGVLSASSHVQDEESGRASRDRRLIDVAEDSELRKWAARWGVTVDELLAAVEAVGPLKEDVERHLRSSR